MLRITASSFLCRSLRSLRRWIMISQICSSACASTTFVMMRSLVSMTLIAKPPSSGPNCKCVRGNGKASPAGCSSSLMMNPFPNVEDDLSQRLAHFRANECANVAALALLQIVEQHFGYLSSNQRLARFRDFQIDGQRDRLYSCHRCSFFMRYSYRSRSTSTAMDSLGLRTCTHS